MPGCEGTTKGARAAEYGQKGKWEMTIEPFEETVPWKPGEEMFWPNSVKAAGRWGESISKTPPWVQHLRAQITFGEQLQRRGGASTFGGGTDGSKQNTVFREAGR